MLLHVLSLDVRTASLDIGPWVEKLYVSNDLRGTMPSRAASLTLLLEGRDAPTAARLVMPRGAVFAETNLCTARCYYADGRFYARSEGEYWHEMEYDMDAHVVRANLGGRYTQSGQTVVSNLIRPLLQSFLLPFYGLKTLHGAVLSKGDGTLFLSGAGGMGKSTTTAQLIRAGYDLISDDGPFFTLDGGSAYALSSLDYLHVTEHTLSMFPELRHHVVGQKDHRDKLAVSRAGLQRSDAWRRPLRVTTFVRLRRREVPAPRITSIARQEVLQELLTDTMIIFRRGPFRDRGRPFQAYSEFIFDLVADVVRHAEAVELEFANHHLPDVPALLDGLTTRGA